jgi:hypothetical protein
MTDTSLTPSAAGFGTVTITASAALFSVADDAGRLLSLKLATNKRNAASSYVVGEVFYSDDRSVVRLYRVLKAGVTAAADMAGTTPDYDQAVPVLETSDVVDGTALLFYLGRGKSTWGWGKLVTITSTTSATLEVSPVGPLASTAATYNWAFGAWGGARGWPRTVAISDSRSVWGGSIAQPQTIWTSQTGDYENMAPREPDGTVFDTNGLVETIDDDQLQTILWLLNIGRGLAVGTIAGEFMFGPASSSVYSTATLSPSNAKVKRQGRRGSAIEVPALLAEDVGLFVQRGGKKHRQLVYDIGRDAYTTNDITVLSDHILSPGIVDAALQEAPDGLVWAVRSDGLLVTLTFDVEQKVRAYGRHQLGGGATVESVCSVPAPDGISDDIYISVLRTIGDTATRWIEVIRAPYRAADDGNVAGFFVDAGLSYAGAPATHISGLDHLEGQSLAVCADGVSVGPLTVTGGAITLEAAASTVHAGLGYVSRLTTMPVEAGAAPGGTAQGKAKRINEVTLRLLESTGGRIGRGDVLEDIKYPDDADRLYTGDVRDTFPIGWDRSGQVTIEQADPLPLTVLAIVQELQTNG